MMRRCFVFGLMLVVATACASRPDGKRSMDPVGDGGNGGAVMAEDSAGHASLDVEMAPEVSADDEKDSKQTRSRTSGLTPVERAIWNDPGFQKRFAESYLAETEVEPRVTLVEREIMQEILELISANKLDRAASKLEGKTDDASNAVYDFTLANIYFQQERLERAARFYRSAIQKFARFLRAYRNLGLIHIRRGEFAQAIRAFTRAVELGAGDAVTYGRLGYAYTHLGNPLSAESAYRMANLLDPANMAWKMGLAQSLFKQQRYADAAALFGTLIAENPERTDLWLLQANAYIGLEQPLRAAENYEFVERLGGSTVDSLNMLGDIYVNEDLYDLAVASYVRALEKSPERSPDRAVRAAKVLAARGAFAETHQLLTRIESVHGQKLEPEEQKDILKLRARLAVAEGAGEEEARVLEKIVELDPLDGEALILLGQHCRRAGDLEKAVFYFERAASLEAFEADARVRHAQLLVGQGKYNEALPLLRRAQELKPREHVQQFLEQVERRTRNR